MKIYAFALSAPSRFVMSVLKHAKIDFEAVDVDLTSQEQKSEAHLKRNPNGKVPVMEDGDFTLFESLAIIRYVLDTKAPNSPLFPTDVKIRAKINQYLGGLNDLRIG
jgi:glutathione S-transferase